MGSTIRQEQPSDFEQVYNMHQHAFDGEEESKLVDRLRQSDSFIPGLALVAVEHDKIVGHILFYQNPNTGD